MIAMLNLNINGKENLVGWKTARRVLQVVEAPSSDRRHRDEDAAFLTKIPSGIPQTRNRTVAAQFTDTTKEKKSGYA